MTTVFVEQPLALPGSAKNILTEADTSAVVVISIDSLLKTNFIASHDSLASDWCIYKSQGF